ncbi:MAG: recombination protein O N-terminal domain-containing protein, partial [Candidatus Parcubacteria bacterium]|nr:recombination protein O N-terminal domain-containing protein [Burkholderiales bacterium]
MGQGEARLDRGRATPAPTRLPLGPPVKRRAQHEPGFVLHAYPYKETSLIVEVFTRAFGRVGLLARGAR